MTRELEPDNAGERIQPLSGFPSKNSRAKNAKGNFPFAAFARHKIMIATKESFEPHSSEQLPASKKIYVEGV